MDTVLMREFVVFSRYLNFSRAAAELNLAQPTLSSHVAAMERELGFDLVQRGKRLRLTPAGKRFCADAERLISQYGETVKTCQDIARQKAGTLVFERPIHQGGIDREFDLMLLKFQEQNPSIAVRKQTSLECSMRDVLETDKADFALMFNAQVELLDAKFAEKVRLLPVPDQDRGPYFLWLDKSHPLASKESVALEELSVCRFLIPSSIRYQSLENLARVGTDMIGSPVVCSYWPGSYEECIVNIRPDEVMIVNDDDRRNPAYDLVKNRKYVPLSGMETIIKPCFVHLKANDNPAVEAFSDFMDKLCQEWTAPE